ncbi:MAG: glycosyltransferase family 39 protein, partial [Desulfobacula sp.]|nr:glycosyltransferase family 39 protein [Desulfobacula sp.]
MLGNKSILVILMISFSILCFSAVMKKSITSDEAVHLTAGYEYIKYQDFRWNPEHPPLAKEIAAMPLLLMDINASHDTAAYFKGRQFQHADDFLHVKNKKKSNLMLNTSRAMMLLFGFIIMLVIFFWASELAGEKTALVSVALFAFSPVFLAHTPLITTDVSSASFGFLSFYMISKVFETNKPRYLIFAGISMGLSLSSKHSAIIIIPIAVIIFLIGPAIKNETIKKVSSLIAKGSIFKQAGLFTVYLITFLLFINQSFLGISLVALLTVIVMALHVVKLFETKNIIKLQSSKTIRDYCFCISFMSLAYILLALIVTPVFYFDYANSIFSGDLFKSFNNLIYVLYQASQGHRYPTFLNGQHSWTGFWQYYLFVFIAKASIPLLVCLAGSIILVFADRKTRKSLIFLLLPVFIYMVLISIFNKAQIGIRHTIFIFPFIMVAAAVLINFIKEELGAKPAVILSLMLIVFQGITAAKTFPDYISFTNGLLFKPQNAYMHISDSNLDWGQNVKKLVTYLKNLDSPEIKTYMYYQKNLDSTGYNNYTPVTEEMINDSLKGILVVDVQKYNLFPGSLKWLKENHRPDKI